MKSEASKRLEEYARGIENPYDDFVSFIGRAPQSHGVDEDLLRYIEDHPGCGHDEIFDAYIELALIR